MYCQYPNSKEYKTKFECLQLIGHWKSDFGHEKVTFLELCEILNFKIQTNRAYLELFWVPILT